ncbi:hypothetical protein GCM10022267_47000 [Lentzea roselyniae]|uniref:PASTA domain-containing protein n=1 Tax=Lentzea roselyniae TaxID=531940 RepID=A0ABP7BDL6_9PSEU
MKRWGAALLLTAVVAAAVYLVVSGPDGNDATDKKAQQVADRIGYPVGADANAYARSALAGDPDPKYFAVVEITDSPTNDAQKVRASLVFRIYDPGTTESDQPWRLWEEDPVTACYRADFNYYGVTDGGPERVRCPEHAKPITPPPAQRTGVPDTYPDAFKKILAELPPTATKDAVLAALREKLPPVPVDEQTKLPQVPPHLDAVVKDGDIGVVAKGGGDCLTGVRLADGTVEAWYPRRVHVQPGELGCSGESALSLYKSPPK